MISANWEPPPIGSFKANFDVVICPNFAVAAATLRDHKGDFLAVNSLKLPSIDVGLGEAHAALLAVRLAASTRCSSLLLEGDSLVTVLAIIGPSLFFDWNIVLVIAGIHLHLFTFSEWKALKILRCANSGAH